MANAAIAYQQPTAWVPQPGPQTLLLHCAVRDICYGGARGGGKTDGVLGHWGKHELQCGEHAQGIVFRRRYKQLERIIARAKQLFRPSGAKWFDSKDKYMLVWPSGATLRFRHLQSIADAEEYQGHEYSWICFEELTQWPAPAPIDLLYGCLRSAAGAPCWFLSTSNPGGPGHVWVKERYITPAPPVTPFEQHLDNGQRVWRVFIPAKVWDNPALIAKDPEYIARLSLTGPEWLVRAWLEGDWDITVGGYLEGAWDSLRHVVSPFAIPLSWPRWRALDWGYAKPYSIGWYAMHPDSGKIYRYRELYGYGGKANTGTREDASAVAQRIADIERQEARLGVRFRNSPADSQIWTQDGSERAIIDCFRDKKIQFTPSLKGPGSRVNGAQLVVYVLKTDLFAVFNTCRHFLRTVPVIPADEDNPEDVDTEAEDHCWDELRYSISSRHRAIPQRGKEKKPAIGSFDWLIEVTKKKA